MTWSSLTMGLALTSLLNDSAAYTYGPYNSKTIDMNTVFIKFLFMISISLYSSTLAQQIYDH